ncbi:sulfatase family protein [Vallitalea okinawensis]|uniref:sulfatase family protein n=1 Tax=Vallitalea okinawensis TaxID=2078660 RepID=UPI000CFB332F|nr:sulfatase-like hydrolase/transferase [Vallitalea okinawensis]
MEQVNKKKAPNILLIHADQHRFDCLGAYGNKDIKTPNIDSLARDGVVYNNSFCSFPVCTPSRYSLLSGLQVRQHSGWTNHCTLPSYINTFPKVLRSQGYQTASVGKMHFTPTYLDVGFDKMVLCEQDGPGRFDDDYHRELMDKGLWDRNDLEDQRAEYRENAPEEYWDSLGSMVSNLQDEYHSTSWIGRKALEEITEWKEDGNLLMVGFVKPHHPFDPSESWSDLYDPNELSILPGWTEACLERDLAFSKGYFPHDDNDEAKVKKVMAYYYANISHIDHEVGKMIALLKEKGLYDNTIIIYTSDHGDYMGFHHLMLKGNYMYDPVIKVPLIIKYVNSNQGGGVSEQLVSNIDLASTIVHLAGVEKPEQMEDYNILEDKREFVVSESGHQTEYMIRDSRYKLLLSKDENKSLFFDLENDPLELENRYYDEAYQDAIKKFKEKLRHWALFEVVIPTSLDEYADIIKQDNALGYDVERRGTSEQYFREKMR